MNFVLRARCMTKFLRKALVLCFFSKIVSTFTYSGCALVEVISFLQRNRLRWCQTGLLLFVKTFRYNVLCIGIIFFKWNFLILWHWYLSLLFGFPTNRQAGHFFIRYSFSMIKSDNLLDSQIYNHLKFYCRSASLFIYQLSTNEASQVSILCLDVNCNDGV